MAKNTEYLFDNFEKGLLELTCDAIECCITSAYLNEFGVDLLERIAERLSSIIIKSHTPTIRIIISNKFTDELNRRVSIVDKLSKLPGTEVRIADERTHLHQKNYIFKTTDEIRVVLGSLNLTSAGIYRNKEVLSLNTHEIGDDKVKPVIDNFESIWNISKPANKYLEENVMNNSQPKFSKGDNVVYTSTKKIGTINEVKKTSRSYSYIVTIDGNQSNIHEQFLELHIPEDNNILDNLLNENYGDLNDFRIFNTWYRLKTPIENNIYSYLSSKTAFNPHQFKPLLRFLSPNSDERLFIADEVGVGKTIETGIIITELIARQKLDSQTPILIICPNSIGPKWAKEMKTRFNLNFRFHNGESFRELLSRTLDNGFVPPEYLYSIVSIQLIRSDDNITKLKRLDASINKHIWNLIIIDEAHHLRNTTTLSNEMGHTVSGLTDMMLMLSATPINLHSEDLFNLMSILNPEAYNDYDAFCSLTEPIKELNSLRRLIAENTDNSRLEALDVLTSIETTGFGAALLNHEEVIGLRKRLQEPKKFNPTEAIKYDNLLIKLNPLFYSFTRTRKREAIEHQIIREVWDVPVKLSAQEKSFYNKFLNVIEEFYLLQGLPPGSIPFITNIHQRMLSSCIPAIRHYLKWCIENNSLLGEPDNDLIEGLEDDTDLKKVALPESLLGKFEKLVIDIESLEEDTKVNELLNLLEKIFSDKQNKQVIIFSFFVRTIKYLELKLKSKGFRVKSIHGEIPLEAPNGAPSRYNIMADFEAGNFDILLSSEVGGEGLDFQYCHTLVNYDLPYNPMKVEQRIGRVDRFGQMSNRIIVANFFIAETVDAKIYERLYRRINLIEDGVGMYEPILGKDFSEMQNKIISGSLTDEQIEELTRRIEEAVENTKKANEEFDNNRQLLLGDDYLANPIEHILCKDFVKATDIMLLTETYLKQSDSGYKPVDENSAEIKLNKTQKTELEEFLRRPENYHGQSSVQQLIESSKYIDVYFDGSKTSQYNGFLFLSPTGIWSKFLVKHFEQTQTIQRTFSVSIENDLPEPFKRDEDYLIFFYEVKYRGFKEDVEFLGIPVTLSSGAVIECQFENTPRLIASCSGNRVLFPEDKYDTNHFNDIAFNYLSDYLEEKMISIQNNNSYRVTSKINALVKAKEMKVQKLEDQKAKHIQNNDPPNEKYLSLTNARIQNSENRTEIAIENLNKRLKLTHENSLVAVLYIKTN